MQAMRCSRGERVVLHAAAGGVGLAAMQALQTNGCIPIGTAGSPSKCAIVRALGCAHVLNSRDASFAEGIAMLGGAQALLNSMTTPGLIAASLSGGDYSTSQYMISESLKMTFTWIHP